MSFFNLDLNVVLKALYIISAARALWLKQCKQACNVGEVGVSQGRGTLKVSEVSMKEADKPTAKLHY